MNQILEGKANANGTPNELDQGYVHAGSSQAPTIEEHLPNDDTGPSQARNAPPQSPPSTIHHSCIWHFCRYIQYGHSR
jgi:hypothetical protein